MHLGKAQASKPICNSTYVYSYLFIWTPGTNRTCSVQYLLLKNYEIYFSVVLCQIPSLYIVFFVATTNIFVLFFLNGLNGMTRSKKGTATESSLPSHDLHTEQTGLTHHLGLSDMSAISHRDSSGEDDDNNNRD